MRRGARWGTQALVLGALVLGGTLIVHRDLPGSARPGPGPAVDQRGAAPTTGPRSSAPGATTGSRSTPASASSSGSSPGSAPTTTPGRPALSTADRLAGLRSREVPESGSGAFVTAAVAPAAARPPGGDGRLLRVRVQIERGLPVDGEAFGSFVLATLNDSRSWRRDGVRFVQTTGTGADLRVVLATPDTSAAMCLPLRTFGRLSCRTGDAAVLTLYRWVRGMEEYRGDLTGYRRYLVNHEVGHLLGKGHVGCPGRGRLAPVMMQQTKGLLGCRPNAWPYPG